MKLMKYESQLWMSGTSMEVKAQLRRLMMQAGEQAKVADILRDHRPIKMNQAKNS